MDENNRSKCSRICDKSLNNDESDASDAETRCGFAGWTPAWLQWMASPMWYMVVSNILGILQGAFGMYMIGVMSTIEKRFGFQSKVTAIIMIADNFSPIIFSSITGYYASHVHRPRLIALGMLVVVIACYMNALPFFIYGASYHLLYESTDNISAIAAKDNAKYEFCEPLANRDKACADLSAKSQALPALIIFFVSNFLNGVGHNAFYTAGFTYLDDNVNQAQSPLFIGLTYAVRLLGPQLGYFLAGFALRFWENPLYEIDIKPTDPRYVGAYWMGFLILGTLILIFAFPMALFPKRMPGMRVEGTETMPKLKEFPRKAIKLLKNPILALIVVTATLALNAGIGYFIFQPKYLENQFRKTSSEASILTGSVGVITSAVGIVLGSLVINKFKPNPKYLIIYMVALNYVNAGSMLSMWFMGCDNPTMAETSIVNGEMSLVSQCNSDCLCTTRRFDPVCGGDRNFFSPCHAGCTTKIGTDAKGAITFGGCKCVGSLDGIVTKGYCESNCSALTPYLSILGVNGLLKSTSSVGDTLLLLRCVEPKDKSFALGLLSSIINLLACIPAPLVFGALTDAACDVWQRSCGRTGQCWLYNIDRFRHLLHGTTFTLLVLTTLSATSILLFVNRLKNFYGNADDTENNNETEKAIEMNGNNMSDDCANESTKF